MLNKSSIYQFIPKSLDYLTNKDTEIIFNNHKLKNEYLIDIVHMFLCRYYFNEKQYINLCSTILREKYGTDYNYYINYLITEGIISKTRNYFNGGHANEYKIHDKYSTFIESDSDIIRYDNTNKNLLKKWIKNSKQYSIQNQQNKINSKSLFDEIMSEVIDDLYHIQIDQVSANLRLKEMLENKEINFEQYTKNRLSIESIANKSLFHVVDDYKRLHTNFTVLKKSIRTEFITIENEEVEELDVPNSQPTFLALLMKDEKGVNIDEYNRYKDLVYNGKFYDNFSEILNCSRSKCKKYFFTYLFGQNIKDYSGMEHAFKTEFPTISKWIADKKSNNKYTVIAHELQSIESEWIFCKVVKSLKREIPDIKLFTVHDSIIYPKRYSVKVNETFQKYMKQLIITNN